MAGSVRLDIVAQAQDKATATMKKVSAGLNRVGKDAKSLQGVQRKGAAATAVQRKSFLGLNTTLAKTAGALAAFGLAMQGIRAVGAVVRGAATQVTEMVDAADNIAKIAPSIGLTSVEFQRLDFALKITGSSMEGGAKAMKKFSRAVKDAQDGSIEAVDTIKELGIETQTSGGHTKGFRELLDETADAFAGMDDGIRKTALAQELFGRSGAEMLNFMNLGSDGINRLGDEAEALGGVMSDDMAAGAEEAKDAMLRFDTAILGLKLNLAPVVENLTILATLVSDLGKEMQGTELEGEALAVSLVKGLRNNTKQTGEALKEMTGRLGKSTEGMRKTADMVKTMEDAERRAAEIIAEGNEKAGKSFKEAEEFALKYWRTVGLAGEVASIAAAGHDELTDAKRRANDVIDDAIILANLSDANRQEEIAGLVMMVNSHDGLTIAQQEATKARKEWNEALKNSNMLTWTTLERLADLVIATSKVAKEEKKSRGGGGGRGIRTRALRVELAKLDITEQGYQRTRATADKQVHATIALETTLAKIQASRAENQITLRDSTLAIAKAQFAYRQAVDKAADGEAKLSAERATAIVEATRAQSVHVIEMDLLAMESQAVAGLTTVEEAALAVARERLEVQRQQVEAMEDSTEQAMAMERANARVAIAEKELGKAIKDADLAAHAQAFEEANAVMGQSAGLLSSLSAEAGAMATGIGDVGSAIGTWGESTESQVAAVDGGIAAGQRLTGALVKDQKVQALILGAMEVARGVALSVTNPIAAGAHFASAALFAAVAGGVIGGGKGAGAGGRAPSRAGAGAGFTAAGGEPEGGGTQQVIVTFGDGVILGSPGQVGKAVAQATGALSGTGMQAAGAF